MVSTSISHKKISRQMLRLRDHVTGGLLSYALYEAEGFPAGIDIVASGVVYDNRNYEVQLLSEVDLGEIQVSLATPEWEQQMLTAHKNTVQVQLNGKLYYYYNILLDSRDSKLFDQVFGFSRIALNIECLNEGKTISLTTRDIPCKCSREESAKAVMSMLESLMNVDSSPAAKWMLASATTTTNDRFALLKGEQKGGFGDEADYADVHSLESHLIMIEQVYMLYDQ